MSQIGTVKFETATHGVVEVPIFQLGDSGSNVYESVRVDTGNEIGFLPTVDPPDADYEYIRFLTNQHGTVAVFTDTNIGLDVNFVIDTSGSIGDSTQSVMEDDIETIVDEFGPDIRFSALDFNDGIEDHVAIDWTTDKTTFDSLGLDSAGTSGYTDGINGGREYITGNDYGVNTSATGTAEDGTPDAMIILGDGTPDNESDAETAANDAESVDGIDVFTYTYNNSTATSEHAFMEQLANNTDDALNKPSGDSPIDVANRIKNKLL